MTTVDSEGIVHLPPAAVPPSRYLSLESRAEFIRLFAHPKARPSRPPDAAAMRAQDEAKNAPLVARALQLYPVNIEQRVIGGVRTQVFTPKAGLTPRNRDRVLINLHGGGFVWGEVNGARTESIPIAGLGRITVIAVAYRMAPEFHFPAASEDVAAVYRELLKTHTASDIGIYGCSAGGVLTAEAVAWFQKEGLPAPGAIGTFCGTGVLPGGDSGHLAALLTGESPPAAPDSEHMRPEAYFAGTTASDPLVQPAVAPQVLARFPPTLLIGGSRDFMVSSLFRMQALLCETGVSAELHVWDGMWHAFFMDPSLPESQQFFRVVVNFFDRHLGRGESAAHSQKG